MENIDDLFAYLGFGDGRECIKYILCAIHLLSNLVLIYRIMEHHTLLARSGIPKKVSTMDYYYYYFYFYLFVIRHGDGKDKKRKIEEKRMILVSEYDYVFNGEKTLSQPHTRKGAGVFC